MYMAKPFLDKESLFALHYSCIHSNLNYANLAWVALIEETTQSTKTHYANSS